MQIFIDSFSVCSRKMALPILHNSPARLPIFVIVRRKSYSHGVRLHFIAMRRFGRLPNPSQISPCEASAHDFGGG
jgi:hypothetical protein